MAKRKPASEERTVKRQIPASKSLADELAKHARAMEWTQGKLAAVLLEFATESPKKVEQLIATRLDAIQKTKSPPGFLRASNFSETRLQLLLMPSVVEKLKVYGDAFNHTHVRMASLLLDCSLSNEKWFMQVLETKLGKNLMGLVYGWKPAPYRSAEASPGKRQKRGGR